MPLQLQRRREREGRRLPAAIPAPAPAPARRPSLPFASAKGFAPRVAVEAALPFARATTRLASPPAPRFAYPGRPSSAAPAAAPGIGKARFRSLPN
jgi:hypothetical protein